MAQVPEPGQPSLPDSLYINALADNSIAPAPDLIAFMRQRHYQQITPAMLEKCLTRHGAYQDAPLKRQESGQALYPDFYADELKRWGAVPAPLLVKFLEEEHLKRLSRSFVISAFTEFVALYKNGHHVRKGDLI